jgi:hypothetical protein
MNYGANYGNIGRDQLRPKRRLPKHLAWIRSFLAPLQTVHDDTFGAYYTEIMERSRYSCQTIVIEAILNKVFGSTGITISNHKTGGVELTLFNEPEGYTGAFFFNELEAGTIPQYMYNETEGQLTYNFTVNVPAAVFATYTSTQIADEVKKYSPFGLTFNVVSY